MSKRPTYPSDLVDKTMVRFPSGLMDRVKQAAAQNGRSMNSEIIATLEEKYPPDTIDLDVLAKFLNSLQGVSAPDGDRAYLSQLNDALSESEIPWTVEAGWDGAVTFYPYSEKRPFPAGPNTVPPKPKG